MREITATRVMDCASVIQQFCEDKQCSDCPFDGKLGCMFGWFSPFQWTLRNFKSESKPTK